MIKDRLEYARLSKWLHWTIAIIVMPMLLSFFMDDIFPAHRGTLVMIHKSLGLTVLGLMIIRAFGIAYLGKPYLPPTVPRWERVLSHGVQHSFYVLLVLMPVSGWIMSTAANKAPIYFDLIRLPFPGVKPDKALSDWMFSCHEIIAWLLIGCLALHVAGALKHYFIDKDRVLQKMI